MLFNPKHIRNLQIQFCRQNSDILILQHAVYVANSEHQTFKKNSAGHVLIPTHRYIISVEQRVNTMTLSHMIVA